MNDSISTLADVPISWYLRGHLGPLHFILFLVPRINEWNWKNFYYCRQYKDSLKIGKNLSRAIMKNLKWPNLTYMHATIFRQFETGDSFFEKVSSQYGYFANDHLGVMRTHTHTNVKYLEIVNCLPRIFLRPVWTFSGKAVFEFFLNHLKLH